MRIPSDLLHMAKLPFQLPYFRPATAYPGCPRKSRFAANTGIYRSAAAESVKFLLILTQRRDTRTNGGSATAMPLTFHGATRWMQVAVPKCCINSLLLARLWAEMLSKFAFLAQLCRQSWSALEKVVRKMYLKLFHASTLQLEHLALGKGLRCGLSLTPLASRGSSSVWLPGTGCWRAFVVISLKSNGFAIEARHPHRLSARLCCCWSCRHCCFRYSFHMRARTLEYNCCQVVISNIVLPASATASASAVVLRVSDFLAAYFGAHAVNIVSGWLLLRPSGGRGMLYACMLECCCALVRVRHDKMLFSIFIAVAVPDSPPPPHPHPPLPLLLCTRIRMDAAYD